MVLADLYSDGYGSLPKRVEMFNPELSKYRSSRESLREAAGDTASSAELHASDVSGCSSDFQVSRVKVPSKLIVDVRQSKGNDYVTEPAEYDRWLNSYGLTPGTKYQFCTQVYLLENGMFTLVKDEASSELVIDQGVSYVPFSEFLATRVFVKEVESDEVVVTSDMKAVVFDNVVVDYTDTKVEDVKLYVKQSADDVDNWLLTNEFDVCKVDMSPDPFLSGPKRLSYHSGIFVQNSDLEIHLSDTSVYDFKDPDGCVIFPSCVLFLKRASKIKENRKRCTERLKLWDVSNVRYGDFFGNADVYRWYNANEPHAKARPEGFFLYERYKRVAKAANIGPVTGILRYLGLP